MGVHGLPRRLSRHSFLGVDGMREWNSYVREVILNLFNVCSGETRRQESEGSWLCSGMHVRIDLGVYLSSLKYLITQQAAKIKYIKKKKVS